MYQGQGNQDQQWQQQPAQQYQQPQQQPQQQYQQPPPQQPEQPAQAPPAQPSKAQALGNEFKRIVGGMGWQIIKDEQVANGWQVGFKTTQKKIKKGDIISFDVLVASVAQTQPMVPGQPAGPSYNIGVTTLVKKSFFGKEKKSYTHWIDIDNFIGDDMQAKAGIDDQIKNFLIEDGVHKAPPPAVPHQPPAQQAPVQQPPAQDQQYQQPPQDQQYQQPPQEQQYQQPPQEQQYQQPPQEQQYQQPPQEQQYQQQPQEQQWEQQPQQQKPQWPPPQQ
jgi:hypothetical protein